MNKNEVGIDAICEACVALSDGDIEKSREIIGTKYPHQKPLKQRKSFTKKEQLTIFMRDGFIDRYSGGRLIFPGVLSILSDILPDVFPVHENWKTDQCHQAWWDLFPSIDHIVPLAFGGTNDEDNLVCTSMKRNMAKATSSIEEIGWKIYPAGKLSEWDGMLLWFWEYCRRNPEALDNSYTRGWYETCRDMEAVGNYHTK
jgi:hypothetical protein